MKINSLLLIGIAALPLAHTGLNWPVAEQGPAPIQVPTIPIASNRRPLPLLVPVDGSVWRGTKQLTERGGESKDLRMTIADMAKWMDREEHWDLVEAGHGDRLAAEALVIRADENAPFDTIGTILRVCMYRDVMVRQVEFEVAQEISEQEGAVDYTVPAEVLPKNWDLPIETELRTVNVELRVSVPGTKRQPDDVSSPWNKEPNTRFVYDPKEREIEYAFEGWKTTDTRKAVRRALQLGGGQDGVYLRIAVAPGVTVGELLHFWHRACQDMSLYLAVSEL